MNQAVTALEINNGNPSASHDYTKLHQLSPQELETMQRQCFSELSKLQNELQLIIDTFGSQTK